MAQDNKPNEHKTELMRQQHLVSRALSSMTLANIRQLVEEMEVQIEGRRNRTA